MRKVPVYGTFLILILLSSLLIVTSHAADNASATFTSKCAMCHGADGQGKTTMGAKFNIKNLASPEVQKQSDTQLLGIITKGKGKMPAFEKSLSQDQVQQLVSHIRAQAKKR